MGLWESVFEPLGVDTGSLRVDFEPLGVDFGPLKSDVRNLGVDSASLGVDFSLGGEFRLLVFDLRPQSVDLGLRESIFSLCESIVVLWEWI